MEVVKLIKSKVAYINGASLEMEGSPEWNKLKKLVKIDLKEKKISEINVPTFKEMYGLSKEYSLKMLISLNKDVFAK